MLNQGIRRGLIPSIKILYYRIISVNGQWPQTFCFLQIEVSPLLWDYCKARWIFVTSDSVIEYSPGGWQTSKKYRENVQLLFFYFLLNGRKIHAELLIEILVPTQIVCWSQEKSLSSSHKYFLLPIFGKFKQINWIDL